MNGRNVLPLLTIPQEKAFIMYVFVCNGFPQLGSWLVERLGRNVCLIVYCPGQKKLVNCVEWRLLVKDSIPKLQTSKPTFRKGVEKGLKDLAKCLVTFVLQINPVYNPKSLNVFFYILQLKKKIMTN